MHLSNQNIRPIGIDLFAGAGGLSLGFEQAGFDIAAAVEIDPIHCAVHEYNFPRTKVICSSVADLTGNEIRQIAGLDGVDIDCVFGGAPCQGFSMIGKRALDDPRNHLVFHYVRLVRELRPKYCVFENVKGLTIGKHKEFLAELIKALGQAGYEVALPYKVLNAADFGVPQDRRRLFLLGARIGETIPHYPTSVKGATVSEAIDDLPNADNYVALLKTDALKIKYTTKSKYARKLRGLDPDPGDFSYPREYDTNLLTASLRTEHSDLSRKRFLETPYGKTEPVSRFLKLDPEGVCNTLRAGTDSARGAFTSPRPIHPYHSRVITVREAARLHSYPDWFRFHITKWHGFRQIGNSVPPLLGRAVASEIVKALGVKPTKPRLVFNLSDQNENLLTFDMSSAANFYTVQTAVIAQRTRVSMTDNKEATPLPPIKQPNRYDKIIEKIFMSHHSDGLDSFEFTREEFEETAATLKIKLPKNVGDVLYSFRYRKDLPASIAKTANEGREWVIEGAGRAKYRFRIASANRIVPSTNLVTIKVPDSTPEIIAAYSLSDEQALLAKVRYNRLIDVFLGITTYSLQNHLRTTVLNIGQIEIDEIYVGVDKFGRQYVIPVQAKGGTDKHGVVQTQQDIACCAEKFPNLICRAISAQFMNDEKIALFELTVEDGDVKVVEERHYQLVPASAISTLDLATYGNRAI